MTAEKMNALVAEAREKGGWLIFMTHGMKRGYDAWQNPDELRRHIEWIKSQNDICVLTFAQAAKEFQKQ